MASYHLTVKVISRSSGRSAVAAAAYRARTKIHDQRQGLTFDYSKKKDLVHSEIMLPEGTPAWMGNRDELWNAVEVKEKRKDSQLFREVEIALPKELDKGQRIELVREFVKENFVSKGMVADINLHNLHRDESNPHAHIMLTMRRTDENGFGWKKRYWNKRALLNKWRKNWADIQNRHLLKAGFDITVDHRSFVDRGIDLEPQIKMGPSGHNKASDLTKTEELRRIMRENGERIIADPYIALKELSYHKALISDDDIKRFVNSHSDDAQQFKDVINSIYDCDELISLGEDADGRNKYTTKELKDAEEKMLQTVKSLSAKNKHKVKIKYVSKAIVTRTMNAGQEEAFRHMVKGGDAVAVIGYAGTGKSYTLGAARQAFEAQGYRVMGMALSGIAVEGLQRGSGIKSSTIHSQLSSWNQGFKLPDKKTIVVVDEAGMVGTRQMHRLIAYVKNAGAKLVLVGDSDQLQPIEAGGSFRGIVQDIGSVTIGDVMRQKSEWQKEATKLLSGDSEQVAEALDRYDSKGRIRLSGDLDAAKAQLIEAWKLKTIGAGKGAEQNNIILAYRNSDVKDLNEIAKGIWRAEGRLKEEEVSVETAKGKRNFSEGDRILFLKNNYSMGVKNGSLGTLVAINKGESLGTLVTLNKGEFRVRLDSGTTVAFDPKEYQSFDHGYATTIHKSQGVTVNNAFVLATRHMDKHATYVALSRHKDEVELFAGIDEKSERWDTFKDFDNMKLMLSRDRKKELVRDHGINPLKTLSHHNAIFGDENITQYAEEHSIDTEQVQTLKEAIYNNDELIIMGKDKEGKNDYTADDLIEAERRVLKTVKSLSSEIKHKVDEKHINQAIVTRTMNAGQEEAFRHMVEGGDAVAVIGYAGTGKSYTLGAARQAFEAQGYRVMGMALSGIAVEGLQRGSGIKSSTIHSQLSSWDQGFELPDNKTIVVVDEAGMVGVRQMERLTEYVRKAGAKLIATGDYDQLQPIEAVGIFRGIVQDIGSVTIGDVMRQKSEWQKEATKLLSGDSEQVAEALDRYDTKSRIRLFGSLDAAKEQLIEAWKLKTIGAGKGAEQNNIILAYRNSDVKDLNAIARKIWRSEGCLKEKEIRVETAKGKRSFSEGDRILFLKNEYGMGVKNGSLGTLETLGGGNFTVRLDSGATVAFDPKEYQSFDHGYATTIHKSQGVTVSNAFVLATRHMDKHATYVALSRHKDEVELFAGINKESKKWDTFKDFAHMKLMLSRNGIKELIRDYGTNRDVDVDLGKIYKKGFYEITVSSDKLTKDWTRTQIVSGKLNSAQHREDLREKAQAFADKAAEITGVDKRHMSIKVERINDERFILLNEKWKKDAREKQERLTKDTFLSKTAMARVKWPPFAPEEQERLLEKYNQRYFTMIRFADKREAVQGEYHGDFIHKGVRVSAIDTGREGQAKFALVPFSEELEGYKGKAVRYEIAKNRVTDQLEHPLMLSITDVISGRSFTKTVSVKTNHHKDIETQKRELAASLARRIGPNSGKFKVSFRELAPEQRRQQLEQGLSREQGRKLE